MPLWLDLLRTPMAAPETRSLRRMRFVWQLLCLASAGVVGFFVPLHHQFGQAAPVGAAILLAMTAAYTCLYLALKHRADTDFLERAWEAE